MSKAIRPAKRTRVSVKNGRPGKARSTPKGFHTINPYLAVHGLPRLIKFLEQAFGAREIHRHLKPNGDIANAELRIGDSMVMTGELPPERQPMPAMLYMYVDDVDAIYKRAVQAGGQPVREPADQYYGDRSGAVADPAGNQWWIATHLGSVSRAELEARMTRQKS